GPDVLGLGLGVRPRLRLTVCFRLGVAVVTGLRLRAAAVPAAGEQGLDQLVATQPAVALDPELRRDRVEVGQRALLEFLAVEDGHEAGEDVTRPGATRDRA